jgi:hypothetical protein
VPTLATLTAAAAMHWTQETLQRIAACGATAWTYDDHVTEKRRPLYVPDLARPADTDAHGEVTCVTCNAHVSVMSADVVGKGYRCAKCSALATPEEDVDASLTPAEQAMVPDPPKSIRLVVIGLALLALATLMWIAKIDIDLGSRHRPRPLFLLVVIGGIGCLAVALSRPKKWR